MGFYLPGIYKPFYIEGLLVHSQGEYDYNYGINTLDDTLFALIDIHNGVGVYDVGEKIYNVGGVNCFFNFERNNVPIPPPSISQKLIVYRDKPLFMSSYQESINSVFYKVDVSDFTQESGSRLSPVSIKVKYTPPEVSDDTIIINRNIDLSFNVNVESGIYHKYTDDVELLYLKQDPIRSNYWHIVDDEYLIEMGYDVDRNFPDFVSGGTSNNVAYYVVNEAFYKYFIKPETYIPEEKSLFYRTYNNGENIAFKYEDGDRIRNFCDLFPYKIRYDNSNPTYNFNFDKNDYDKSKNCCYTKPFLRMFPALNNKLNNNSNPNEPGCCRIVYEGGTIKFEGDEYIISNSNETDINNVNFYLICVKSPLTNNRILGNANSYYDAYSKGSYLNPEQDYITYIRNYGRIKLI
jgi:hypothetical protein